MKCRSLPRVWLMAIVILGAIAVSSSAQQPRRPGGGGFGFGGPGGGMDLLGLVAVEQIQKELEIVDDQKEQLKKLGDERREAMRSMFQGGGNFRELSDEERQKRFSEMREKSETQRKEFTKKLAGILLPHQMDRLQQIGLQVRGAAALADPEVADKLGLSDDQKQSLTKIQEESRQQMQQLFQGDGNRDGLREKMEQARREVSEKSLAVLTGDQKSQFEKMQGEKIELDRSQLFGGGGFRRPGNNDKNN